MGTRARARTRDNGHELEPRKLSLTIRKHFCDVWVTEPWLGSQRCWGFLFGDLQKLPGRDTGLPALVALLEQGLD